MSDKISLIITILCTALASSGFWAYIQHKSDKKDLTVQMLIGLGHDRIVELGIQYLNRGWITLEEYENLHDYLYVPYEKLGGNGSAKRIMEKVKKLPISKQEEV